MFILFGFFVGLYLGLIIAVFKSDFESLNIRKHYTPSGEEMRIEVLSYPWRVLIIHEYAACLPKRYLKVQKRIAQDADEFVIWWAWVPLAGVIYLDRKWWSMLRWLRSRELIRSTSSPATITRFRNLRFGRGK